MPTEKPHNTHTAEQRLREDVDSGRTAEKIDASDPAAVPLGTDAEAGGTPTDPRAASRARQAELEGGETPRRRDWQYVLVFPGFVVLVAGLLALVLLS